MSALLRTTVRAGLVGGLALLATAGAGSTASADSGDLTYQCQVSVGDGPSVATPLTARFDSPVPDDGRTVQRVGATVQLNPFRGTVVLPAEVVDQFRDSGPERLDGYGTLVEYTLNKETDTVTFIDLRYPPALVPASGPMEVPIQNDDLSIGSRTVRGTNLLVAPTFQGSLSDPDSAPPRADVVSFACEAPATADIAFDRLTGTVAPQPPATTAPTTSAPGSTASPVRPDLVQTDAPADEGTPALPAALLGVGALTAAALGWRLRRTGTTRRH